MALAEFATGPDDATLVPTVTPVFEHECYPAVEVSAELERLAK